MDLITSATLAEYTSSTRAQHPTTVSDVVENVLMQEKQSLHGNEQRGLDRYSCSRLVELTPYRPSSNEIMGQTITIPSRDLSLDGVGFYHTEPLAARYGLVQLNTGSEQPLLLMKLIWCRFLKPGWYDNGGRFMRVATTAA